ncbi:MAG: aspartyl/asparaginyl beta-hydroxylase domain-containing protein [Stellaceae bacterium]
MSVLYDQTATVMRRIYDRRIVAPSVLDPATHFPDAERFVAAWRQVRDEALRVAAQLQRVPLFHEIMPEQASISDNDDRDWRMFILRAYGVEVPRNMAACPTLAALVASSSDVLSASLSFLAPRKHIPPHRGPFRGVLRFYLALAVPVAPDGRPAAVLRIDDAEYRLAGGEMLLWDDTYEHEVWNASDEVRTVLLLDIRRRDMPLDMELLSRGVISLIRLGIRLRGLG